MTYKCFFICFLLSSSLITSCAKNEEVSSSMSLPLTGGIWLSNCNYDSTAKGVRFDGTNFNDAVIYFTDSSCSAISYITERIGTYSITTDDSSQPQLWLHGNYDKTVSDYAITPATSAAAVSMNSTSKCGFTDWASGTLKVVTGQNCGSGILSAGVSEYDIYHYQTGELEFGYFNSTNDGSTPEKRPTATHGNYIFKKYEINNLSLSETTSFKLFQFYIENKN